jgi:glyoxylase-like metal-dependent hydrolase (beta-lactamase superfamily II)
MEPAHMQRMVANMPEAARRQFEALLQNPPKAAVGRTVADGEEVPFCGGITVVFTPGHTYGHISLYHRPSRVLIAGDALVILEGKLCGPRPQNAADIGQAVKSLEKFAGFDIATVVCYHGGVCSENVSARIAELAKGE